MPSLPPEDADDDNPLDRFREVGSAIGSAAGADSRVTFRMLVLLLGVGVCVSFAPIPWAPIGVAATILIGLDVARRYISR